MAPPDKSCPESFGGAGESPEVIGVAGACGKTTVCFMIARILEATGFRVGMTTGVFNKVGTTVTSGRQDNRRCAALLRMLGRMRRAGCQKAVVEVSSRGNADSGSMNDVMNGVTLGVAAITNLPRDGLGGRSAVEQSPEAAVEVFAHLARGGSAVVNGDDQAVLVLSDRARRSFEWGPTIAFSTRGGDSHASPASRTVAADGSVTIGPATTGPSGHVLRVDLPCLGLSEDRELTLRLAGAHNMENAACATAAALAAGATTDAVCSALESFSGVWRRFQVLLDGPVTILDDSADNPVAITAVLDAVRELYAGDVILAVGVRAGAGVDLNRLNGMAVSRAAASLAPRRMHVVVTPCLDRLRGARRAAEEEVRALIQEIRGGPAATLTYCPSLRGSVDRALELARPGDVIAVMGSAGMNSAPSVVAASLGSRSYLEVAEPFDPF